MKASKITQPYPRCIAFQGMLYTRSRSRLQRCFLPALPGAPCCTIDPTSCRGAGDGRYMAHDASAFGSHHGEKWMDLKYPKKGMKEVDQKKQGTIN